MGAKRITLQLVGCSALIGPVLIPVNGLGIEGGLRGMEVAQVNHRSDGRRLSPKQLIVPFKANALDFIDAHDTNVENVGSTECGSGPVDSKYSSECGGCYISHTSQGEWIEYEVSSLNDVLVDFAFKVASRAENKRFHVELDGKDVSGPLVAPSGGYQSYEDRVAEKVYIRAGVMHRLRFILDTGSVNLCSISTTLAATLVPSRTADSTRIEAEHYQSASDTTPEENLGKACDRGDGVDMQQLSSTYSDHNPFVGGCVISHTRQSEWLEYKILAKTAQFYSIVVRVASALENKSLKVFVGGGNSKTIKAPSSGWDIYADRDGPEVFLEPGEHTVSIKFKTGRVNLNYIEVKSKPREAFDVAVYLPREINTCIIGERCKPGSAGCKKPSDRGSNLAEIFERDLFEGVKTTSSKLDDTKVCVKLVMAEPELIMVKKELELFRENVKEKSHQDIDLKLHLFEIPSVDIGLQLLWNGLWIPPWEFGEYARMAEKDFIPDFNLVFQPMIDPEKELHIPIAACGLAYGANWGSCGAGWSWIPITRTGAWFECAHEGVITHEWLHQIHYAYQTLSHFEDKYRDDGGYPECGKGHWDTYKWMPDTHQCTEDPDYESCGKSECTGDINGHVLGAHWDPALAFIPNRCADPYWERAGSSCLDQAYAAVGARGKCGPLTSQAQAHDTPRMPDSEMEMPPPQYKTDLPE